MNAFDTYIYDILHESVIDIPRNSLDPTVFQFPDGGAPIMHPIIKTQIMANIDKFRPLVPVVKYFVVGSILTKNYTPHSDIDVNVQIDPPNDRIVESIFDLLKNINGKLAAGTTHPINFYAITKDYDLDKTDAAYDVANESWIKEPKNVGVDVDDYMNNFKTAVGSIDFTAAELRRDIIDLETLQSFDEGQVQDLSGRVDAKIKEIESGIESIVSSYSSLRTLRKTAFEKDMSPAELRKYGKKNKLPENVIYKLIERYYYFDFMRKLKEIIADKKVTPKEIKKIKNAGRNLWK